VASKSDGIQRTDEPTALTTDEGKTLIVTTGFIKLTHRHSAPPLQLNTVVELNFIHGETKEMTEKHFEFEHNLKKFSLFHFNKHKMKKPYQFFSIASHLPTT